MTEKRYLGLAVWCTCMIYVGRWAFGLSIDVWTTGCDIMLGLGPWQPRITKIQKLSTWLSFKPEESKPDEPI